MVEIKYGIQSGSGFFIGLEGDLPEWVSDPVCAERMSKEAAESTSKYINGLGFEASVFEIRHVSI